MLYAAAAVGMFAVGLFGALDGRTHPIRKILAVNVMGSGVFLLLVSTARRSALPIPDPVPHALVLTGIVVSVSATALGLAIVERLGEEHDDDGDERDERDEAP
jgi:multicomponent Na+:H+ antiporter subunit C